MNCDKATSGKANGGHHCICHQAILSVSRAGVVLWSRSPVVMNKVREQLGGQVDPSGGVVLRDADWQDRVRGFAATLTPIEQAELMAASVVEGEPVNPWSAAPIERFLGRVATPWLADVLNGDLLRPWLQPIIDVKTERVVAFEALMRADWNGEVLSAGRLIEAARCHDAMFQFDQKARAAAIRYGWPMLEDQERLFINFSPSVIYDPAVCLRTTWRIAQDMNCDLGRLVFEVVESEAFPQIDHLKNILNTYRDHGTHVALDDLGSGRTAINYIDALSPDLIKLDRDLLPTDPGSADVRLLEGLVSYAHGRGIQVLIEGVETADQLQLAHDLNADFAQGYFIGKPAPDARRTPIKASQAIQR